MALINDFMSLIYPRHCEACGGALLKHEAFVCTHCRVSLPKSQYHQQTNHQLVHTFAGRVPLQQALSLYLFEKSGRVQKLVHAIKYQGQQDLGEFLGELYAADLQKHNSLQDVDMILPIPLHRKKLRARGFNQSECYARGLAKGLNKPVNSTAMARMVETATQTRRKKYERWENVAGIFEVKDATALINKHVLLVDDVITTGATIEAAWLALKDIEGIKVSVASIAFAART